MSSAYFRKRLVPALRAEYAQITKWSIYQGKPGSYLPENAPATA
jgi:hypothetical protein